MSDRPAAITASLPVDMSNPPFDMSNGVSGTGAVVTVPMNELLQPPHPPTTTGMYPIVVGGRFPDLGWDPALRAQVVLAEFAATDWRERLDPGPPDDTPASLLDEITSMISPPMLLQRGRRLAEIIAQAEDATLYWTDMLMLTVSARPWTCCPDRHRSGGRPTRRDALQIQIHAGAAGAGLSGNHAAGDDTAAPVLS